MLSRLIQKLLPSSTGDTARTFAEDPNAPWLISFPRTGSHWLRMILERYTDQPLLPRSFFDHGNSDYLLCHSHDYEFALRPRKLIYLYRDPTPTVFSQIKFHQRDVTDPAEVELWSRLYQLHLRHWLLRPHDDRTVVRYEQMQSQIVEPVRRVLNALGKPADPQRILRVAEQANRQTVARKTEHDPRVINRDRDYAAQRRTFIERFDSTIRRIVISEGGLESFFTDCVSTSHKEAA